MSVGFGFSAGDFIAAVQLVGTVIDALRDSGDSSTEYRSLIGQLHTLETALLRVKRLELDDSQHAEVIALRQAAAQCQRTIDAFWEKIKKYQPSLRSGGSGSRVKDGWRKVKWAVCKKEDVMRFKADLMAHTESIELLLTTVQMAATRIDMKNNEDNHKSLAGRIQDSYFGCMQKMTVILETVSTGIRQGKQLVEMTAKVIQTNVQIFQIVLNLQNIITRIPGQIERQQPVDLIDALGRHTPFHLEFITSAEALRYVLQHNFRNIGTGATKIEDGEFAIQDSIIKRDVDLELPWEACFSAGQQVAMSMVFNSAKATNMYCPKCREDNGDDFAEDEDIECRKCKMVYRRTISWTSPRPLPSFSMTTAQITPATEISPETFQPKRKRKKAHDDDEEMALFRRVRIKTSIILPTPDSRPGSPEKLETHNAANGTSLDAFRTRYAKAGARISAKILEHTSSFPYYLPPHLKSDTPQGQRWIADVKSRYSQSLALMDNATKHIEELDEEIAHLSPEDQISFQKWRRVVVEEHANAKSCVEIFHRREQLVKFVNRGSDRRHSRGFSSQESDRSDYGDEMQVNAQNNPKRKHREEEEPFQSRKRQQNVEETSKGTADEEEYSLGEDQYYEMKDSPAQPTPLSLRSSWTPQDDATLIAAHAQGMNWAPIQPGFFPSKTPNAYRKRHERLMARDEYSRVTAGDKEGRIDYFNMQPPINTVRTLSSRFDPIPRTNSASGTRDVLPKQMMDNAYDEGYNSTSEVPRKRANIQIPSVRTKVEADYDSRPPPPRPGILRPPTTEYHVDIPDPSYRPPSHSVYRDEPTPVRRPADHTKDSSGNSMVEADDAPVNIRSLEGGNRAHMTPPLSEPVEYDNSSIRPEVKSAANLRYAQMIESGAMETDPEYIKVAAAFTYVYQQGIMAQQRREQQHGFLEQQSMNQFAANEADHVMDFSSSSREAKRAQAAVTEIASVAPSMVVSPATAPLETDSKTTEYTIPGAYFSPLGSPALLAQDYVSDPNPMDITFGSGQQETYGSTSSTASGPRSSSYASTLSIAASSITNMNSSYGRLSPGVISPVPTGGSDSPYTTSLSSGNNKIPFSERARENLGNTSMSESATNMMRQMETEEESAKARTGLSIAQHVIMSESRKVDIETGELRKEFTAEAIGGVKLAGDLKVTSDPDNHTEGFSSPVWRIPGFSVSEQESPTMSNAGHSYTPSWSDFLELGSQMA